MPKLLADFLQEQQEPFALEAYLLERDYRKHYNSARYGVPNCSSHLLRAMSKQFIAANGGRRKGKKSKNVGDDGFSLGSSEQSDAGGSHYCSESAIRRFVTCGNCFMEGEVDADTNLKLRAEEDSKQLSPVSVLGEKTELDFKQYTLKAQGETTISRRSYHQYLINAAALQQGKQLLNDCTREVIGKERNSEEIWKHVCEKVWIWSQDSIRESNIVHLLHSEFLASADEWSVDFEQKKLEICAEIENAILENAINEMVYIMVDWRNW